MLKLSLLILLFLTSLASFPLVAYAAHLDDENLEGPSPYVVQTVIGGTAVAAGTVPSRMTVRLEMTILSSKFGVQDAICSGTLIAKDIIVTAGHCVVDLANPGRKTQSVTAVINGRRAIRVIDWKVNPGYQFFDEGNALVKNIRPVGDIAVLKLEFPIGPEGMIADIPDASLLLDKPEQLMLAGFGRTDPADAGSAGSLYFAWNIGVMKKVANNQDYQIEMSGVQPCMGDSGGPVFKMVNRKYQLVGVTSHGKIGCTAAGRAISVFYHLPWIKMAVQSLRNSRSL